METSTPKYTKLEAKQSFLNDTRLLTRLICFWKEINKYYTILLIFIQKKERLADYRLHFMEK